MDDIVNSLDRRPRPQKPSLLVELGLTVATSLAAYYLYMQLSDALNLDPHKLKPKKSNSAAKSRLQKIVDKRHEAQDDEAKGDTEVREHHASSRKERVLLA